MAHDLICTTTVTEGGHTWAPAITGLKSSLDAQERDGMFIIVLMKQLEAAIYPYKGQNVDVKV